MSTFELDREDLSPRTVNTPSAATTYAVDWRPYIRSDPEILLGKPTVAGTRLAVDFLLRLFAVGWTEEQILENYPTLTPPGLRAVFSYAAK